MIERLLRRRQGEEEERRAYRFRNVEKQFIERRFAGPRVHTEQLDGLRIAHITDMHVGRITPIEAQYEAVRRVNEGKADAVAITGDFVCHSTLFLDELQSVIERIDAPVFCVLGNHDYWSDAKEVRWALRRAGAEVLDNAHTTITLRRQALQVVGLDDAYTGHADREKATKGLRRDRATLGLSHIGEEADGLWQLGVPLVLSGHTHAGQITVARLHELSVGRVAGHRYVHGLYGTRAAEEVGGAVYVGAGVGAAVIGLRIGERAKREVTFFELGEDAAGVDESHGEQLALRGRKPSERTKQRRRRAVLKKAKKRERRSR
ncbi:MAG: metallophosphoesterase [Myxococcota bacterium]